MDLYGRDMLVHTVYFWLNPELSHEDHKAFENALQSLREIPSVKQFYCGTPSKTADRPVVDHSYDYGLAVVFDDVAGHDFYSEHSIHQDFLARWKDSFAKIQVYDFD